MKNTMLMALAAAALVAATPTMADQPRTDPKAVVTDKPDPTLTPRDLNEKEQDYLAALRKCEALAEMERRECAAKVKSRYGLM